MKKRRGWLIGLIICFLSICGGVKVVLPDEVNEEKGRGIWRYIREDAQIFEIPRLDNSLSWLWCYWKDNENLYYVEKDYLISFNINSKKKKKIFRLSKKDSYITLLKYSPIEKEFFMIERRKNLLQNKQKKSEFRGLIFNPQQLLFKIKEIPAPEESFTKDYILLEKEVYCYYEDKGIIWKERISDKKKAPLFVIKDLLSPYEKETYEICYSLSSDLNKIVYKKGKALKEDEKDILSEPSWERGIWIADSKTNKMINEDCLKESLPKFSPDGSMIGYWLWKEIEPNKRWSKEHIVDRGSFVLQDVINGRREILFYTDMLPTASCFSFIPPFAISPDNSKIAAYTYFNICHKMGDNIKEDDLCWHKEDCFNFVVYDYKKKKGNIYREFTVPPYKDNSFLICLPSPVFSPDSKKVAFFSKKKGKISLFVIEMNE